MKAKMGEIDGKMVIYRRNLGQNSRWNTNLPLKFKSGRWITNWDKSGCWITLLTLESHLGRWINAGVIWAVRSRWREERNISKKSAIYRWNIGDFPRPQAIIWRNRRFIGDLLAIYCKKSSPRFFSWKCRVAASRYKIYRRYIAYISRYFPPWTRWSMS